MNEWKLGFTIALLTCTSCIALFFAISFYNQHYAYIARNEPADMFGLSPSVMYFTVEAFDAARRTLDVQMKGTLALNTFPARIHLQDGARIQRQDALIENGVFTGLKARYDTTVAEVVPGIHAYAVVTRNPQTGTLEAIYILVGDPFPRP